jgi:hypothetical protein
MYRKNDNGAATAQTIFRYINSLIHLRFSSSLMMIVERSLDKSEVHYLQSQNGNLFSAAYFTGGEDESDCEYLPLRDDIPSGVPWCSEALGVIIFHCLIGAMTSGLYDILKASDRMP